MEKIELGTPDITEENIDRLGELFPSVLTEVEDENGEIKKAVDFDALRELLGNVAEGGRLRYQFTWPGKSEAKAEAHQPILKTLRPEIDISKNWDTTKNVYIRGDNFDALKLLKQTYAGKVKLIYIDPPYNTGSDAFVYPDSFVQSEAEYQADSGDFDSLGYRLTTNTASYGKYHSVWCSMMFQRLILARELLRTDGVIYINIDHVEFATLKMICDEIFGASCFVAHVAWKSSDSSNNNALSFSEDFNDCLVYSRTPGWRPNFLNDPEKRKHYKNPDNDPRGPWFDGGDVSNPGVRPNLQFDITTPSGKVIKHPTNGWRWSKERMEQMFASGELRFSEDETRVIKRRYLADMKGLPPSTLWDDVKKTGHTRAAKYELKALFPELPASSLFSTPKPVALIDYILKLSLTQPDDLVLDFFSGSGTTAHAVMKYNAENGSDVSYILVQVDEPLANSPFESLFEMGRQRIVRAGKKIMDESANSEQCLPGLEPDRKLDVGFRVLRIDSSNMTDTYATPDETRQETLLDLIDSVKDGRSHLDLLFEVLPKFSLPYSAKIEEINLAGKRCFSVEDGVLVACFDSNVDIDTIEEIARMKPVYAVVRDASLVDDATEANFEELFKTYSPSTERFVL